MDAFVNAWKSAVVENYANFSGRLGVGGYWRWVATNFALFIVLAILSRVSGVFVVVYVLAGFALFIPGLAAAARRLHDTGRSAMWLLIALVPCVGVVILLVFAVQPGTPGPNEFGEPPAT